MSKEQNKERRIAVEKAMREAKYGKPTGKGLFARIVEEVREKQGKNEVSYVLSCPDEESIVLTIKAYSSLNREVARLQGFWSADEKMVFIGDFVVVEHYRNKGVGSHILKEVVRIAGEIGAKTVCGNISLVDDVKRLYAFYRKRGFTVTECVDKGDNFVATIKLDLGEHIFVDEWRFPLGEQNG